MAVCSFTSPPTNIDYMELTTNRAAATCSRPSAYKLHTVVSSDPARCFVVAACCFRSVSFPVYAIFQMRAITKIPEFITQIPADTVTSLLTFRARTKKS